MASNVRTSIRVEGVVQGVGFRPFVYSLATRLGLAGWVGNDVDGVFAEVEGPAGQIRDFLAALERDAPPLARVERVSAQPIAPDGRRRLRHRRQRHERPAPRAGLGGQRDLRGLPA